MRLIGQPVLRLQAAQAFTVGHGQVVITTDHGLECGLPPGQFQFGPDLLRPHFALCQVVEQFRQTMLTHVLQQQRPLRQGHKRLLVRSQFFQPFQQRGVREGFQVSTGVGINQSSAEGVEFLVHCAVVLVDLRQSRRD